MNKELHELSTKERGILFPIILAAPQDNWEDLYQKEKAVIIHTLGENTIKRIEHIGSTAIPGIKTKPTIDILVEIKNKSDCDFIIYQMRAAEFNYIHKPENPPPHMMFVKGYTKEGFKDQAVHVHIRFPGDWDEIYFRDYLIHHPEIAKKYELLKIDLQIKYKNDREAYTNGKTAFVNRINILARKDIQK